MLWKAKWLFSENVGLIACQSATWTGTVASCVVISVQTALVILGAVDACKWLANLSLSEDRYGNIFIHEYKYVACPRLQKTVQQLKWWQSHLMGSWYWYSQYCFWKSSTLLAQCCMFLLFCVALLLLHLLGLKTVAWSWTKHTWVLLSLPTSSAEPFSSVVNILGTQHVFRELSSDSIHG